jgi:DNA-binding NarL/FixJ family response regulator
MTAATIRLLAVDDHAMLREGIAAIVSSEPDITIVGEATNGQEAVEQYRRLRPDIMLIDLQMPVMSGLDAIAAIREEHPSARIIVLTTYKGDVQALRAIKAGASGYLLKSSLITELLSTIRAVHAGRRYIPAEIAQEIAFHATEESLTSRELAILELVAAGKANKLVAHELTLSEETVKAHLRSIFSKLGVSDRTQAVTTAFRRGILSV